MFCLWRPSKNEPRVRLLFTGKLEMTHGSKTTLKLQAQAELHYAGAAAAEAGISLGHVGSLRDRGQRWSCRAETTFDGKAKFG